MTRLGLNRIGVLMAAMTLLAAAGSSQDLGSANKLFGGSARRAAASRTGKKSPAKTSSKPKTLSPKASTTAKKALPVPKKDEAKKLPAADANKGKRPEKSETAVRSRFRSFGPAKPSGTGKQYADESFNVSAAAESRFDSLINQGNEARDARDYSTAEKAYNRAKSLKPRDARASYGLGNLYSDQQRWEDAEAAYREAIRVEPTDAVTHIALSYVLTQPTFSSSLGDRYAEAERTARRAVQLAGSNPLAYDQLGVALELRGLIGPETERAYRRAIELDPGFAPSYAHLGRLLRRRGAISEANSAYSTAISRATNAATMILVAEVMQSEQKFADSEPLLRRAVADDSRNPAGLMLLGRSLSAQGKYSDAEQILKRALAVSPNAFMPNSLLGSLYWRQGKLELAENALLRALPYVSRLEKRQLAQQFEAVGDAYFKAGKRVSAERVYRHVQTLDPANKAAAGQPPKG